MDYTLNQLEMEAASQYRRLKARLHKHYHLARELGFTSSEAVILQSRSESVIRALAAERREQKSRP